MTPQKSKTSVKQVHSVSDLARYLDLSDWTVSRAINGHPEVKKETRERVLQAMQDTGFQPSPLARGLRGKGTGLVGICFADIHSPVVIEKVSFLDRFLRENRLRSILTVTGYEKTSEIRAIEDFHRLRVEGIVLEQSSLSTTEASELLRGVRRVFVDSQQPHSGPSIRVDRLTGMHLLTEHLISLGHCRFGLLGITRDNTWRWPGMESSLREHGFDPDEVVQVFETPVPMEMSYGMGAKLAEMVLASTPRPTALVAMNDMVALGAVHYLQHKNIKIPEDFSVTGFDNLNMTHFLHPTITTIDQQPHQLMEQAGRLLLHEIRPTHAKVESSLIFPTLVRGESTGPAPITGK